MKWGERTTNKIIIGTHKGRKESVQVWKDHSWIQTGQCWYFWLACVVRNDCLGYSIFMHNHTVFWESERIFPITKFEVFLNHVYTQALVLVYWNAVHCGVGLTEPYIHITYHERLGRLPPLPPKREPTPLWGTRHWYISLCGYHFWGHTSTIAGNLISDIVVCTTEKGFWPIPVKSGCDYWQLCRNPPISVGVTAKAGEAASTWMYGDVVLEQWHLASSESQCVQLRASSECMWMLAMEGDGRTCWISFSSVRISDYSPSKRMQKFGSHHLKFVLTHKLFLDTKRQYLLEYPASKTFLRFGSHHLKFV